MLFVWKVKLLCLNDQSCLHGFFLLWTYNLINVTTTSCGWSWVGSNRTHNQQTLPKFGRFNTLNMDVHTTRCTYRCQDVYKIQHALHRCCNFYPCLQAKLSHQHTIKCDKQSYTHIYIYMCVQTESIVNINIVHWEQWSICWKP